MKTNETKTEAQESEKSRDGIVGVDSVVRCYSIRNHLGCEVGFVETSADNPVAFYACEVGAEYLKLRLAGYTAREVTPNSSEMRLKNEGEQNG